MEIFENVLSQDTETWDVLSQDKEAWFTDDVIDFLRGENRSDFELSQFQIESLQDVTEVMKMSTFEEHAKHTPGIHFVNRKQCYFCKRIIRGDKEFMKLEDENLALKTKVDELEAAIILIDLKVAALKDSLQCLSINSDRFSKETRRQLIDLSSWT